MMASTAPATASGNHQRRRPFADLAGYTGLTEAHGDGNAAAIALTFHVALLRAQCEPHPELVFASQVHW
jgi:hypothetical protein